MNSDGMGVTFAPTYITNATLIARPRLFRLMSTSFPRVAQKCAPITIVFGTAGS